MSKANKQDFCKWAKRVDFIYQISVYMSWLNWISIIIMQKNWTLLKYVPALIYNFNLNFFSTKPEKQRLTAHNWQKRRSRFLTRDYHKIYGGRRSWSINFIIIKLKKLWILWIYQICDNYMKTCYFVNNLLGIFEDGLYASPLQGVRQCEMPEMCARFRNDSNQWNYEYKVITKHW